MESAESPSLNKKDPLILLSGLNWSNKAFNLELFNNLNASISFKKFIRSDSILRLHISITLSKSCFSIYRKCVLRVQYTDILLGLPCSNPSYPKWSPDLNSPQKSSSSESSISTSESCSSNLNYRIFKSFYQFSRICL